MSNSSFAAVAAAWAFLQLAFVAGIVPATPGGMLFA